MTMVPAPVYEDLFEAVLSGEVDAVVRLLRSGAPAEATDEDGVTVLYTAAVNGRAAVVRLLLAAGADPGRACGEAAGDLPLCGAACNGHTEAVRALLAAGAWPDQREEFGFTALAWAVRQGRSGAVEALLEYGADPARPGPDGRVPLVAAARRGSLPIVRALLERGAPGREEALAEARSWLGRDVEAVLREGLAEAYASGAADVVVRRLPEDEGVTVVVEVLADGVPAAGNEQQTGHAAIVTLLEEALGVRAPAEDLAGRALGCADPGLGDWVEAAEALGRRGDEETFTAAVRWCGASDPLRQALGADVLARLTAHGTAGAAAFRARALPVLRELGREVREAEPALAVVRALGAQGDPAVLPDVLRHAVHPDTRVRRGVAVAVTGLVPRGHREAVAALTVLARDGDAGVRAAAAHALAVAAEDSPPYGRCWRRRRRIRIRSLRRRRHGAWRSGRTRGRSTRWTGSWCAGTRTAGRTRWRVRHWSTSGTNASGGAWSSPGPAADRPPAPPAPRPSSPGRGAAPRGALGRGGAARGRCVRAAPLPGPAGRVTAGFARRRRQRARWWTRLVRGSGGAAVRPGGAAGVGLPAEGGPRVGDEQPLDAGGAGEASRVLRGEVDLRTRPVVAVDAGFAQQQVGVGGEPFESGARGPLELGEGAGSRVHRTRTPVSDSRCPDQGRPGEGRGKAVPRTVRVGGLTGTVPDSAPPPARPSRPHTRSATTATSGRSPWPSAPLQRRRSETRRTAPAAAMKEAAYSTRARPVVGWPVQWATSPARTPQARKML
nr:ankyrin repeat domain-containing protein [Streptomyces sp. CC228A]